MALAVTKLETWPNASVATMDNSHAPDGWTVAAGSCRVRPVGALKSADTTPVNDAGVVQGSSMLVRQTSGLNLTAALGAWNGSAFPGYFIGFWVMLDEGSNVDDGSHTVDATVLLEIQDFNNNGYPITPFAWVYTPSTKSLRALNRDYTTGGNPITYSNSALNTNCQWVFMVCAFNQLTASTYEIYAGYRLPGDANLTRLTMGMAGGNIAGLFDLGGGGANYIGYPITAHIRTNLPTNGTRWEGRMGGIMQGTIGAISDVTWSNILAAAATYGGSTFTDPPTDHNNWYQKRTAAGSGNGLTRATAWTLAEMYDEVTNGGIVPTLTGKKYADGSGYVADTVNVITFRNGVRDGTITYAGDVILIDGEGSEQRSVTAFAPSYSSSGICFKPYSASLETINSSYLAGTTSPFNTTWTSVSGIVWSMPLPAGWTSACVWEDDKWLAFANSNTAATAIAYCQANPGSFGFSTATNKIYLSALGSGNPNSNGHIYDISGNDATTINGGWSFATLSHWWIENMKIWKTACALNVATNGASPVYGLFCGYNGLQVIKGCQFGYGGKHTFGFATTAAYGTGSRTIVHNNTAFQSVPATAWGIGAGAQTVAVFYVDTSQAAAANANQIMFSNFDCLKGSGLVGSTAGTVDANCPCLISHTSNGGGPATTSQFSLVVFDRILSGSTAGPGDNFCTTGWEASEWCRGNWGTGGDPSVAGGLTYILTAGALTAVGSKVQIASSADGTLPYTYQLQYASSDGIYPNVWANDGAVQSGSEPLLLMARSGTYQRRVVITDAAAATWQSDFYSLTASAATGGTGVARNLLLLLNQNRR